MRIPGSGLEEGEELRNQEGSGGSHLSEEELSLSRVREGKRQRDWWGEGFPSSGSQRKEHQLLMAHQCGHVTPQNNGEDGNLQARALLDQLCQG